MHQKRLWRSGLFVILLAGLLFSISLPVHADDGDGDGDEDEDKVLVEITGKVVSLGVGGGGIVVDGVPVAPAGAFDPSTVDVGDCVLVTGYLLKGDVLQAVSLEPSDDCQDDDGDDDGDDGDDGDDDGDDGDDGDDDGDDGDDDGDDGSGCDRLDHPVLTAYADEFVGVSYDDLAAYHCDGVGLGEIGRALLLAEAAGADYKDILADRADGKSWGEIKKDIQEEYGIDPSELAPGRVISGRHGDDDDDDDTGKDNPGHGGTPPGLEDKDKDTGKDNPGSGDTPPGLDDKDKDTGKDNPGHGGTPPGLKDKDKDKDKGNPGGGKKQ